MERRPDETVPDHMRIVPMSVQFRFDEGPTVPRGCNRGDPVACERCAARVELLTVLPRSTDHSAYRIFACTQCAFVQWIPE